VLLDLAGEVHRVPAISLRHGDLERRVDLGQVFGERDVDDDAHHLLDAADVASVASVLSHSSPQ
jgi:hypothetical protein